MWPPQQPLPVVRPAKPRRAPSLKATRALAKAADKTSPDQLETLNLFVEGKLMGLSNREAALHAGVVARTPKQLAKRAWEMSTNRYVRKLFAELREQIAHDKLCTFAEQVLDVKTIAFDQCNGTQGRMLAHSLLADLMGHRAAVRVKAELAAEVKAGVMLIPAFGTMTEWEEAAKEHQHRLREASK